MFQHLQDHIEWWPETTLTHNTHTSAIPALSASSLYTGDFTKGETHNGSHLTKRQGDPRSAWWRRPFWVGAVHPLAWISWCRDKKPQAWEKACAKHRLHIWYYYILLSEEKSIKGYHGVFDWRERFPLQGNCYIIRILYHMLTLMLLESIRPKYCNQPGLMVKFGLTFHYSLHDCLRIVVHCVSFFEYFWRIQTHHCWKNLHP